MEGALVSVPPLFPPSILSFTPAVKLPLKAAWQWEAEGLLVAMAIRKPQGWRNQEEMRISMAAVEISLVFLAFISRPFSLYFCEMCPVVCHAPGRRN